MFGSFPPSPLVGLRLQSLLGPGSRHCLWNHFTQNPPCRLKRELGCKQNLALTCIRCKRESWINLSQSVHDRGFLRLFVSGVVIGNVAMGINDRDEWNSIQQPRCCGLIVCTKMCPPKAI